MCKKVALMLGTVALALLSCQQPLAPPAEELAPEQVVTEAQAAAAKTMELVVLGKASGDFTELRGFLAVEDPDGEVLALLEEQGVLAPPVQARGMGISLPSFAEGVAGDTPVYMNGDILVSKGSGTTSSIMELALPVGYSHGGILNADLALLGEDAGCVLSADVDYLTTAGKEGGFTYETYQGWEANNDVVMLLRESEDTPNLPSGDVNPINGLYAYVYALPSNMDSWPSTDYAFLGYPGACVGAFEPIPRTDDHYWYCSKVPWRVYDSAYKAGVVDEPTIEDADFYFENGERAKYQVFKEAPLYDLYKTWLVLKWRIPWWRVWRYKGALEVAADAQLRLILTELIAPDELRAYAHGARWEVQRIYGNPDFDRCWDALGGWSP